MVVTLTKSQYKDIVTWQGLIDKIGGPLPWIVPFLAPQWTQVLAAETRVTPAGTKENRTKPATVFQGRTEETEIFPPPYFPSAEHPMAPVEEAPGPQKSGVEGGGSPALSTRSRRAGTPHPDSMVALPLRPTSPPNDSGNQPFHYWPCATSDLYN